MDEGQYPRKLRAPFVITVAVIAPACLVDCGGESTDHTLSGMDSAIGGTNAGGGSGANSGTGAMGGSDTTADGALDASNIGGTDGGADSGACPETPPIAYFHDCVAINQVCSYALTCQSGTLEFTFTCRPNPWDPSGTIGTWLMSSSPSCTTHPYDSCPGPIYCDPAYGWMGGELNPPVPCPSNAPANGAPCIYDFTMAHREKCGYPCGPNNQGWMIASCPIDATQWSVGSCDGG